MTFSHLIPFFKEHKTPFYYYDVDVLQQTLESIKTHALDKGFHVHFALKANNQPRMLDVIRKAGFGADCVSGGEIERAIENGFPPQEIAFAGVGKSDEEIEIALKH